MRWLDGGPSTFRARRGAQHPRAERRLTSPLSGATGQRVNPTCDLRAIWVHTGSHDASAGRADRQRRTPDGACKICRFRSVRYRTDARILASARFWQTWL